MNDYGTSCDVDIKKEKIEKRTQELNTAQARGILIGGALSLSLSGVAQFVYNYVNFEEFTLFMRNVWFRIPIWASGGSAIIVIIIYMLFLIKNRELATAEVEKEMIK